MGAGTSQGYQTNMRGGRPSSANAKRKDAPADGKMDIKTMQTGPSGHSKDSKKMFNQRRSNNQMNM